MNTLKIAMLLIFSFMLFSSTVFEDKKSYPGYVVYNNDQKVEGIVQPGTVTDNEVKIKMLINGKKKTFKPKDIKAYAYEMIEKNDIGKMVKTWIKYERQEAIDAPKPFGSTDVFMQIEVNGALTLYSYYVEMRAKRENPFQHSYYVKNNQGKLISIDEKNFVKKSKKLFKAYSAMSTQIGKKQFRYSNFVRMVRDYNYWLLNQHDSTVYKVSPENYDNRQYPATNN